MDSRFVAVDTETNGKDVRDGRGKCHGITISYRAQDGSIESFYLPFFHYGVGNYDFSRFHTLLQRLLDNLPIIFHNAKFDIVSLGTIGLRAADSNFYDTMLLVHQVRETLPSKSLDFCAKFFLGDEGKKNSKETTFYKVMKSLEKGNNGNGWEQFPAGLMAEYAAYDGDLTLRLFEHIWPIVRKEGTEANWYHRREMVRLLIKMERNGVKIDTELCEEMVDKGEREMERITAELGGAPTGKFLEDLILNKLKLPPQYNIDKVTKKQKARPTFDKKAMEVYDAILERKSDPTAQLVNGYRGWQKSVSSNYQSYLDRLSPDQRLRPNYLLHGTKTGRLSCQQPNLQQIPKGGTKPWNGQMKKCFIPEPGFVLVEGDYSQLEFRLGASYAKERALLDVFNSDRDIFDEMAAATGMDRQDVKTQTYSIQYGGGVNRISTVFGISRDEARQRIDLYYDTYPGLRVVQKKAEYAALSAGRVQLWSGRYRHLQFPQSEAFKAFNSVIQGGAADIVERTMRRCDLSGLNNDECRMLLQVHDSIVFEIREDKLHAYAPRIKAAMEAVQSGPDGPKYDFGVRFAVDLHYFGGKEKIA